MIPINHRDLDSFTLNNLLAECVTREGTDYGSDEVSTATKIQQLKAKLDTGEGVIIFHSEDGYCEVVNSDVINDDDKI